MFDPKKTAAERMARRRFEAREVLDHLKDGPCKACGRKFEPCQMDLVRRGDDARAVPVAQMLHLSKRRLVEEAARCDLLCANCSRLRTWKAERKKRSGPT